MTLPLTPAARIVPEDPGRSRLWGRGSVTTTVLTAAETGGALGITRFAAIEGERAPLHTHTREDEIFMIRSGRIRLTVAGQVTVVEGSGVAYLPRGLAHAYLVESPAAEFEVITTPGGFERFFAEAGYPLELRDVAPVGDRWSPARAAEIAERLGLGLIWHHTPPTTPPMAPSMTEPTAPPVTAPTAPLTTPPTAQAVAPARPRRPPA